MKKFPLLKALVAMTLVFLVAVTQAFALDWTSIAKKAQRSLVSLQVSPNGKIYCSGIVIDDRRDYVLTAAHCTNIILQDGTTLSMYVDSKVAWVIWSNKEWDLAVIKVEGLNKRAIEPGKMLKVGEEVAAMGYGYGWAGTGMFRTGQVSGYIKLDELPGVFMVINSGLIPGMSGGPMVDTEGRLVAINQLVDQNGTVGLGRSIEDIYRMTKDFWERKVK